MLNGFLGYKKSDTVVVPPCLYRKVERGFIMNCV